MEIYFKTWWIFILINTFLLSYYLVSTHDFHKICNVTEVNPKLSKIVCSNITINNTFADIKLYYGRKSKVDVIIKDSHIKLLNDNITHPQYEHDSEEVYDYYSYEELTYGLHIEFTNNVIDKFEIGLKTGNLRLENNTIVFLTSKEESTSNFYSFDTINLNNNIIKHISPKLFSKLSKWLISISMMNCSLTKIPEDVFGINQMRLVALSYNHFTSIPAGAFVDMEKKFKFSHEKTIIFLDHCDIEAIEKGAFQGLEMRKLNFSNNNIKTLSQNIFVDCHLVFIDLTNNQIESLNPNSFSDLGTSLESVVLKNNKISVLPARMFERNTALIDLDLTDNPITTIEPYAFQGMIYIEINSLFQRGLLLPYIEMNQISSNTYNGLQSVKKLDLSNHFVEIMFPEAFQGLSSVEYLNLSYNNIERILPETFLGLNSIKYVNLSNNNIFVLNANSFLGLDNPHQLLIIDLSYNEIQILPAGLFDATPRLTELRLDHNNISDLDKETFSGLKYMSRLDLSYNALSDLFKEVLYPMTSLDSFNIDSNNITQMDMKDILDHLKDVKQVNLNNNPWTCSFLNNMVRDLFDKQIDFLSTATEHYTVSNVHGIACLDIEDTPHDKNTDENNVSSQSNSLLDELVKGQIYQNNLMIIMNWILACGFIMIAVLYVIFNRHHIFNLFSNQSLSRRSEHGSQVELINIK